MVRLLLLFALSALNVAEDDNGYYYDDGGGGDDDDGGGGVDDGGYYYDSEGCVNDDSTTDSDGGTCSTRYDSNPGDCGSADDDDFTASEQCCACAENDDDCVNDDSTTDSDGGTCSTRYDSNPGDCGSADDDDFTASEQCCACAATDDNCVDDLTTTGLYNVDCTLFNPSYPSMCGYYDDADFTASLQCCACGGFLGKTFAPTATPAPSTSAPSAIPTTPAPTAVPSTAAPTTSPAPTCASDDSTTDRYGYTCSSLYDNYPSACGDYDDNDFTASLQCCACGGYLGKTAAPTVTPAPTCASDDSTTDSVGATCSTLYDYDPSYCGSFDDEDFVASMQCCACGGFLGKTFAPTITLVPSMSQAPSVTPVPSPAPTATPAPTVYCLCNRTLVVAVDSGLRPDMTEWTLTMGDAPDNCVDGSAAGGPYSDAHTLYTQEITICEDVMYTIDIDCCWNQKGYFYLELDGTRFQENKKYTEEYSIEFTSLATTFFLKGSLAFDGISYESALANEAVFVAAIAWMCDVAEVAVSVTISQGELYSYSYSHGRRLDDGGVTVAYDVAVEDGGDVMTIINRVEGFTEAEIDATFELVADDAGVADLFEALATKEVGTLRFTDPFGPYSFSYEYTVPPTSSQAPSLSPVPSPVPSTAAPTLRPSMSSAPSITPAPTVTFTPTRSPYEYQPTDDAPPYCRVDDVSVCWGNLRRFLKVKGGRPFDTIAWPDELEKWNPAFADLDHDGDLDMVVGAWNGKLYFYQNVGSTTRPEYVAVEGRKSPFDGIDVGKHAAPVLVDLDLDGDLDLIVGENKGKLFYFENKGSARRPEFDQTGDASLFAGGIATGDDELDYKPALADLDNDGA